MSPPPKHRRCRGCAASAATRLDPEFARERADQQREHRSGQQHHQPAAHGCAARCAACATRPRHARRDERQRRMPVGAISVRRRRRPSLSSESSICRCAVAETAKSTTASPAIAATYNADARCPPADRAERRAAVELRRQRLGPARQRCDRTSSIEIGAAPAPATRRLARSVVEMGRAEHREHRQQRDAQHEDQREQLAPAPAPEQPADEKAR